MSTTTDTVTIRHAGSQDAVALKLLAMLDSTPPLGGPVLVAESAGLVLAAMSLQSRGMMEMRSFNLFYATFWSVTSVAFLIIAFLRLRKLTARN